MTIDARRSTMLPYGRQTIDEDDIEAVAKVLRSDWLTTGPAVAAFEGAFARAVGAEHAVAVSSGTAALHAAVHAAGIGPGDEVIVPPITFVATANAVLYAGGRPIFADVDPTTLLVDPDAVVSACTPRTKAILAVDYAGQPADYRVLREIAEDRGVALLADGCHALGAQDAGRPVGALADMTTFSFHPVKHVTTGEGGMVTTDDPAAAARMRVFRNHGITTDHRERQASGTWAYEMVTLGHNLRLSDIHAALGLSQLGKLERFLKARQWVASSYDRALATVPGVTPLATRPGVSHAYHLYVVRLGEAAFGLQRDDTYAALRTRGIGANVHYAPVHLHPFYRGRLGTGPGLCPVAEAAAREILSLPCFPAMTERDVADVVAALAAVHEEASP